jgi:hypothetical protein
LTIQELQAIQQYPEGFLSSKNKEAHHRAAALAERVASELGKIGLSIEEVLLHHAPFFPESADREEPRWKALARLQKEYQKILGHWGYIDHSEMVRKKLSQGCSSIAHRVLIAGVVDFPPLFISFFKKTNPEVIVAAPESHAAGFDEYGRIISSYWLEHPAEVPEENLIPCERSRDQAARAWEIITHWKKISPSLPVTIVAPEAEALPLLREAGAATGFPTRWAGGRLFQGSSLFFLLEAFQKFLDRVPGEPPSFAAVADLLRHPIVATKLSALLKISSELLLRELDDWEQEHLSLFLEEAHLKQFHKEETLGALLRALGKNFVIALEPEPLDQVLQKWRSLLFYLLEEENVRRSDPEGHFFLACFEKLLLLLDELEKLTRIFHGDSSRGAAQRDAGKADEDFGAGLYSTYRPSLNRSSTQSASGFRKPQQDHREICGLTASAKLYWSGSELLSLLLEILSKESIPELEQPQAIEIIGWLEAAAEDIPTLLLTSFHEGAVPSSLKSDPLLSERLRKKLGLGSAEEQLARDHYYLQLMLASRKKEGGIAILAPRYNGRDEPVRPSRLLLQGCSEKQLPERILALMQRQPNATVQQTTDYKLQTTSFNQRPLAFSLQPSACTVTALRTYLRSPRLFYLQHILKLREVLETPLEMGPQQFGVLLHRILAAFSAEPFLRKEKKESLFHNWLEQALDRAFRWQFGKNSSPAVSSQKRELLRTLKGFARAEAAHRTEGWQTIAVEGMKGCSSLLEEKIVLDDGRSLVLQGRIDRLDWHPEKKRWLLLDYKTSHHQEWKKETPNRKHFKISGDSILWHDLQLPLYLRLAPQLQAVQESGLPLPSIENTDLCFFQLPIHPDAAGITEPFNTMMIQPAWEEARRIIALILDGRFEEVGTLDTTLSPTWKALCGVV